MQQRPHWNGSAASDEPASWGKGRRGREGGDGDGEGDEEYRREEKHYRSLQESYCGPREHRCQQRPHNDNLIVIIMDYLLRVVL